MCMDTHIRDISSRSSLSRTAVARRSGVHRSTLYRALDGSSDIRLETLEEIALAYGLQAQLSYVPLSDPVAADAARVLLEGDHGDTITPDLDAWMQRLQRYAGEQASPVDLALEAARASTLLERRGALGMRGDFTVDRLASAGYATGEVWALSGSAALEALDGGDPDDTPVNILWTSQPQKAMQLLADSGRPAPRGLGSADLIIAEPSDIMFRGLNTIEGISLVSPVQAIIDNLGLHDQQRDRAISIARAW